MVPPLNTDGSGTMEQFIGIISPADHDHTDGLLARGASGRDLLLVEMWPTKIRLSQKRSLGKESGDSGVVE